MRPLDEKEKSTMTRVLVTLFALGVSMGFVPPSSGLDVAVAAAQTRINIVVVNDGGFDRVFTVADEVCGQSQTLSLAAGGSARLSICASSHGTGRIKWLKHGSSGWVQRSLISNGETINM
jgi:hypothetical protein